jgi:hypothetical protein
MTTSQPPPLPRLYSIYCRSRLAGDDDLTAAPSLSWLSRSIVEPACQLPQFYRSTAVGDGLAVRPPSPASRLLQFDRRTSVGDGLAVRPPSPASRLLQFDWLASVGDGLAVRPPSPASRLLQFDWLASVGDGLAVKPPSLRCGDPTSQLLQGIGVVARVWPAVHWSAKTSALGAKPAPGGCA